jgi:hypothetical protein
MSAAHRDLLLWIKRHRRPPRRLTDKSSEEKATEARLAKILSNLRHEVKKTHNPSSIADQLDQVNDGARMY